MLTKILLDENIVPGKKFDWNNYNESESLDQIIQQENMDFDDETPEEYIQPTNKFEEVKSEQFKFGNYS